MSKKNETDKGISTNNLCIVGVLFTIVISFVYIIFIDDILVRKISESNLDPPLNISNATSTSQVPTENKDHEDLTSEVNGDETPNGKDNKQAEVINLLEKRYEEVNEILGKNYLMRSVKCLEFCHEGEKLALDDFGMNVSDQKMSEIGDYCYSYCREDTEYYIKWYREDIKTSLVRLQKSIDYVKSSNAS